jgi:hypothetical protein
MGFISLAIFQSHPAFCRLPWHTIACGIASAASHLAASVIIRDRVKSFKPQSVPKIDPKMEGWQRNPDYQQENGQFGH